MLRASARHFSVFRHGKQLLNDPALKSTSIPSHSKRTIRSCNGNSFSSPRPFALSQEKQESFTVNAIQNKQNSSQNLSFKWPHPTRPRVCILGGGFGGLYTALRLESLIWPTGTRPQVVLVDQSDRFVFKPLLYELLTKEVDEWEIAPRFTDLLAGTEVQFVRDKVDSVDSSASLVTLQSGQQLSCDWLVLSLGSESKVDFVDGAKDHAQPFTSLEDALNTERKIVALERWSAKSGMANIRVTVVGAGYSGVELAATVALRLKSRGRVQIIDPSGSICPGAPKGNRDAALKVLRDRKIDLLLGSRVVSVKGAEKDGSAPTAAIIELRSVDSSSSTVSTEETDLVLWTVGSKPSLPSSGSLFPSNGRGQAETERDLRVKGYKNVFAIGDAATVKDESGKELAPTAQVAMQQSDCVSWNLWASINGRPLVPFRYTHLGEMLTLGSNDAAVTVGFVEGITLEGPVAHAARKLAYLYRQPTVEHMAKVGISWLAKSAVETASFVQDTIVRLSASTGR